MPSQAHPMLGTQARALAPNTLSGEEISLSINYVLEEKLKTDRPRCGHHLSVLCHVRTNMVKRWEEAGGPKISQAYVVVGQEYGPAESTLTRDVPPCSFFVCVYTQS